MAAPQSTYSIALNDYDGERTTTTYNISQLTPLTLPVALPLLAPFRTAHEGITLGVTVETELMYERTRAAAPGAKASSPQAQRELKWLIRYYDSVTFSQFVVEVGTADASLLSNNSDRINLQDGAAPALGPWAVYKANFENVVDSPDGNDAKLLEAILVGRNT